jgi:hypothetical protein
LLLLAKQFKCQISLGNMEEKEVGCNISASPFHLQNSVLFFTSNPLPCPHQRRQCPSDMNCEAERRSTSGHGSKVLPPVGLSIWRNWSLDNYLPTMAVTSMTAPAAADELEDLVQLAMELAVSVMIWIHEKLTLESTCAALGILRSRGSKFSHGHNSSVLPVRLCQTHRERGGGFD